MGGFNWNIFNEYEESIDNNNDEKLNVKMRILGYYNFPNQKMYPEDNKIEEAKLLGEGLEYSINSLLNNENVSNKLKLVIQNPAVFIFEDENKNLYAYLTSEKIARITNVVYDKKNIKIISGKYQSWFVPGEKINILEKKNLAIENITITPETLINDLKDLLNETSELLPTNASIDSINDESVNILSDNGDNLIIEKNRFIGLENCRETQRVLIVTKKSRFFINAYREKSELINFFEEHIRNIPTNKTYRITWNEQMMIFYKIIKKGLLDSLFYSDYFDFLQKVKIFKKEKISTSENSSKYQSSIIVTENKSVEDLSLELSHILRSIGEILPTNASIESVSLKEITTESDSFEKIIVNKNNMIGVDKIIKGNRVLVAKKSKSYYLNGIKTKDEFINFFKNHISIIPQKKEERRQWNKVMQIIFNIINKGFDEYIPKSEYKAFRYDVLHYKRILLNGYEDSDDL